MKSYLAIDNGVTGYMSIVYPNGKANHCKTPIKKGLDYHKKGHFLNRIDVPKLRDTIEIWTNVVWLRDQFVYVILEQPFMNGLHFKTSISAARSFEATLIVLEDLGLPYQVVTSKQWQKPMLGLPSGADSKDLKLAAVSVAKREYPGLELYGDADSLVMAMWAKRMAL